MGCRTRTKRSITSKQAPKFKLNAANAVVDSLTTAEEQIERSWSGGGDEGGDGNDDDVLCRRYLVEAARLSVRAAIRTGEELDVERSRHRTGLHEHRGRT
jgi:hypothetical protein